MDTPTLVMTFVLYAAAAMLVGGVAARVRAWLRVPAAMASVLTPAPTSRGGVAARLVAETVLFRTLFRASAWTWLFGWCFHAALVLALAGHLRFVTEPLAPSLWSWLPETAALRAPVGLAMLAALAGLALRRVLVARVRFISAPSDHLMLVLLAAIALSGLFVGRLPELEIVALARFASGLLTLDWAPLPRHAAVVVHLALAATLMAVFPFSKLLHAPGLFVTPTLVEVDDGRERRARHRRG